LIMKYKIIENPNYTSVIDVGVVLEPDSPVIRFFLTSIKLEELATFLLNISSSTGYGSELSSIIFFHEMDWEDKEGLKIKDGDVNIYHQEFGEEVISANHFISLLYDYAEKVKKVYENDINLASNWKLEVEIALEKLKEKINGRSDN